MTYQYNDGGRAAAGFKGETGDCGVRAAAIVLDMPYQEVYSNINLIAKEIEKPTEKKKLSTARTGIWPKTLGFYLESFGYKWVPTMEIGSGTKVHLKDDELPKGRVVARVSKHYTAVVDGVINDTSDPSREGTRAVYGYWFLPVDGEDTEQRTCRVCEITRSRSDFSPDLHSISRQCKNCSYIRSHLYGMGITPCPNDVIRLMVRALEGQPA